MFRQFFKTITIAAWLSGSAQAFATDTSLYAEALPDDVSFVRFIGFEDGTKQDFAGKEFSIETDTNGVYIPVSSALLDATPAGSFASILRAPDGSRQVVQEGPRNTQSKVFLFLVNASGQVIDLRLADNSAPVIGGVSPGQAQQRGVNPVKVALGVFEQGSKTPLATFDVTLKRGQNLSFVADTNGVQLLKNRFGALVK